MEMTEERTLTSVGPDATVSKIPETENVNSITLLALVLQFMNLFVELMDRLTAINVRQIVSTFKSVIKVSAIIKGEIKVEIKVEIREVIREEIREETGEETGVVAREEMTT